MNIIPEWAPHVHPMLVHFPIALLIAAASIDILGLLLKKNERLRFTAVVLYIMGTLGALASFFTGQAAADAVFLPAAANPVLTEHADWATRLVWFFGVYAVVRIFELWRNKQPKAALWWPLALLGVGGLFLVFQTGERGGQMVFEHGVGVLAARQDVAPAPMVSGDSALMVEPGKSWIWKPTSPSHWDEQLSWRAGQKEDITASLVATEGARDVLALETNGAPLFLAIDEPLQNVQIDLRINLDDFEGDMAVVHNALDAQNYMFMKLANGYMQQGSQQGSETTVHDERPYEAKGWQQLRIVADRTHFRAYSGENMVTHGHGSAPAAGSIGLRFDGAGVVLLDYLQAQTIEH